MTATILPFRRPDDQPLHCDACDGTGTLGHYHEATYNDPGGWCTNAECRIPDEPCREPYCDGGILLCYVLSCAATAVAMDPDFDEPVCGVHREFCDVCLHRYTQTKQGLRCFNCERLARPALGGV
jgi:hypothetical protein